MIKINLLESVTDKQAGAVVAVERKVSSPTSRLLLMAVAVAFLLVAYVAFDIIGTKMEKAHAEEALAKQQEIAKQLEAALKEQKELEEKTKNITARIDAIKMLRATQAGPSAVLEALKERIVKYPGLFLVSVEQKNDQLTISGNSPDETVPTTFGRDLEFSDGLFSKFTIETQRKDNPFVIQPTDPSAPRAEIVDFTIRCAYTPQQANQQNGAGTTPPMNGANMPQPGVNHMPQPMAAAPAGAGIPPQVARNQ